jgi:decaprenylphospho-beta-D-erythro-pentofuranosid-2-ulose 2-reductase
MITKLVILGATSTIAQATARIFAMRGTPMLLVGRSESKLRILQTDLQARGSKQVEVLTAELGDPSTHEVVVAAADRLLPEYDGVLIAYGTLTDQDRAQWDAQYAVKELTVNFVSTASLMSLFSNRLLSRKNGCLAVITSVAGDRGRRANYVYGAAKGAVALFAQGLRSRLHVSGVRVVTIKPGPVKTPMTANMRQTRMFADPEVVGGDIFKMLSASHGEILYTLRRWKWIMIVVRLIPEFVFKRLPL